MQLIEKLMQEHHLILQYIDLFLKHTPQEDGPPELKAFETLVEFIKNYADAYHHHKEEDILFVELNKAGVLSHCNPVQQMLFEHQQARGYVEQMEQALQNKNWEILKANLNLYAFLLQQHIYKEDQILYPMAEQRLSETQKSTLDAAFEKAEKNLQGSEITHKYETMLLRLTQELEVPHGKKFR